MGSDSYPGLEVIYSDSALLVINKPAGLSTLPDGYNSALPHIKSLLEQQVGKLWIVHRLDKDTSGVLVLARSAQAHRSLNTQFEKHQVSKIYHALVEGNPDWHEKSINLPLRPNGDRSHRTVVDMDHGKPATTHLKVLSRFGNYCLLEAAPETGRTHQIRAHLSSVSLHIVGDKLYTVSKHGNLTDTKSQPMPCVDLSKIPMLGMGLHARSLEITHPTSGQKLKFEATYPAWWENALQLLRMTYPSE
jgi:RluA family pseudouridine synthase